MKGICAVASVVLLSACGGGAKSTNGVTDVSDVSLLPAGVLKLVVGSGTGSTSGKAAVQSSVPGTTYLRVVLRNERLTVNGQVYTVILDTVPDAPLTFPVPVGDNYTVEAIGYNRDAATGLNTVVSYATARNVGVDANGTTATPLEFVPAAATVVPPASAIQGARYNVLVNYSTGAGRNATPFSSNWFLNTPRTTSFSPFANNTSATTFSPYHSYLAPVTYGVPTTLYFRGVFTLKSLLLNSGENPKQWIYNAAETTMPVTAPINLIIVAPNF